MIINGIEVKPGETRKIEVNVARLPSHSSIDITINVSRSKKPGPVMMLMGGLHGDEINGIEIVRRIVEQGHHIPEIGTIICIPILNIFGFIHFSRYVPDGKDVNRSFPGNKNGSLASRVAYYLTRDILPKIDYGIDFHTGGADRTNFPQIRGMLKNEEIRELAYIFNARFTLHSNYRPKSLRRTASKMGKSILVYEGGESSRFDENAIRQGIDGALRVLKSLGMSSAKVPEPEYNNRVFYNSTWVRAKASGIFQKLIKSGDKIEKNQILGYLVDPFGDFKTPIKSPAKGYVIGLNNNPILHMGDAILHIGISRK